MLPLEILKLETILKLGTFLIEKFSMRTAWDSHRSLKQKLLKRSFRCGREMTHFKWEFLKFLKLRWMYSKKSMDNSRFDWGNFGTETSWPWFKRRNVGDPKGDSNRIKFHSERHAIGAELGQNKHGRTRKIQRGHECKRPLESVYSVTWILKDEKVEIAWTQGARDGIPNKCPRYRPESIVYTVSSRYYRVTTNVHWELFLVRL